MSTQTAAQNNALWCDTVCRAHEIAGEWHPAAWINRDTVPKFYPNLVTLAPRSESAGAIDLVRQLVANRSLTSFAVKDSFCDLDLAAEGFQILFEANWIRRQSLPANDMNRPSDLRYSVVRTAEQLAAWEIAWAGTAARESTSSSSRIFPSALLADSDVRIISIAGGDRLVAGCIANRTGNVVGLSNLFTSGDDAELHWDCCVSAIGELFPKTPIVGYERGGDLTLAQACGFEVLSPLRVWWHDG